MGLFLVSLVGFVTLGIKVIIVSKHPEAKKDLISSGISFPIICEVFVKNKVF
jgi:hypothetical protein